jgi:hypothetical protein
MVCDVQKLLSQASAFQAVPPGQRGLLKLSMWCNIAIKKAAAAGLGSGSQNPPALPDLPTGNIPSDSMESYADAAAVNGLWGGINGIQIFTISWTTVYSDRFNINGIWALDTMESYSDAAPVNGLDSQTAEDRGAFTSAYAARGNTLGLWASDDMESYSDGSAVSGLNGGTNDLGAWSVAYRT